MRTGRRAAEDTARSQGETSGGILLTLTLDLKPPGVYVEAPWAVAFSWWLPTILTHPASSSLAPPPACCFLLSSHTLLSLLHLPFGMDFPILSQSHTRKMGGKKAVSQHGARSDPFSLAKLSHHPISLGPSKVCSQPSGCRIRQPGSCTALWTTPRRAVLLDGSQPKPQDGSRRQHT